LASASDDLVLATPDVVAAIEGDGSDFQLVSLTLDHVNVPSGALRDILVATFTLADHSGLYVVWTLSPGPTGWASGAWVDLVRSAIADLAAEVRQVYGLAV
jgi:hypothetical protein